MELITIGRKVISCCTFYRKSGFVVGVSLLIFVPANFFIEIIERNKFCCSCSYSGSFDWDFFFSKSSFSYCVHLSKITSAYSKRGGIKAM